MAICKGCGAEIAWLKTTAGISTPVNPGYVEIDLSGPKVITIVTDNGKVESGSQVDKYSLFPVENTVRGRVSHFATCPKASEFRNRG